MKARYGFAQWTLSADPVLGLRYVGRCLDCGAFCVDTASPEEAQDWCLKHAGATGDIGFELTASQLFTARMTDPAANGRPPA